MCLTDFVRWCASLAGAKSEVIGLFSADAYPDAVLSGHYVWKPCIGFGPHRLEPQHLIWLLWEVSLWGSGKTIAFLGPILASLGKPGKEFARALIVDPSRELAMLSRLVLRGQWHHFAVFGYVDKKYTYTCYLHIMNIILLGLIWPEVHEAFRAINFGRRSQWFYVIWLGSGLSLPPKKGSRMYVSSLFGWAVVATLIIPPASRW